MRPFICLAPAILVVSGVIAQQIPNPKFEVASIKLSTQPRDPRGGSFSPVGDRLTITGEDLGFVMVFAYNLRGDQILGGPSWLRSDRYDIVSKAADGTKPTTDEFRSMLRTLLEERFKLVTHRESRQISAYALVVAKDGPKLEPANSSTDFPFRGQTGRIEAQKMSMAGLATSLGGQQLGFVFDETGLTGDYSFILEWNPYEGRTGNIPPAFADRPSIFTA